MCAALANPAYRPVLFEYLATLTEGRYETELLDVMFQKWSNDSDYTLDDAYVVSQLHTAIKTGQVAQCIVDIGETPNVDSDAAGRPLSQEWLGKRVWNPTIRKLGMAHRGQYNLRDTFITLALSAGEDPGWVAHVCGTSEEMIFGHYRTWMRGVVRNDGSGIARLLGRNEAERGTGAGSSR